MKKYRYLLFLFAALAVLCTGCKKQSDTPITLSVWHVYGGQTDSPLNDLIDRFNETAGAEEGIRVQVTSVSNTNTIHEAVLASANGQPGATELPDIFVSYPKTVLAMPDSGILVDYRDYFSPEELAEFIPSFLDEGVIDGRQVILPVAKSTEIMYINKTGYDKFAAGTGAELSELSTWEGIFRQAKEYYDWTDAQTPDVPHDGKIFFVHDYHFNYFQVGVESLGEDFFDGEGLAFGPRFREVWEPYARAAISGGVWLQSGYATEPLRTGDSIVSVASSASVLYYSNVVTYAAVAFRMGYDQVTWEDVLTVTTLGVDVIGILDDTPGAVTRMDRAAVAPDAHIILKPGDYNFSTLTGEELAGCSVYVYTNAYSLVEEQCVLRLPRPRPHPGGGGERNGAAADGERVRGCDSPELLRRCGPARAGPGPYFRGHRLRRQRPGGPFLSRRDGGGLRPVRLRSLRHLGGSRR